MKGFARREIRKNRLQVAGNIPQTSNLKPGTSSHTPLTFFVKF